MTRTRDQVYEASERLADQLEVKEPAARTEIRLAARLLSLSERTGESSTEILDTALELAQSLTSNYKIDVNNHILAQQLLSAAS